MIGKVVYRKRIDDIDYRILKHTDKYCYLAYYEVEYKTKDSESWVICKMDNNIGNCKHYILTINDNSDGNGFIHFMKGESYIILLFTLFVIICFSPVLIFQSLLSLIFNRKTKVEKFEAEFKRLYNR